MIGGRAIAAAALAAALLAPPTRPAEGNDEIARARGLLTEAADTLRAAREDEARLPALGLAVTAHEAALAGLRAALRELAGAEHAAIRRLQDQAGPLGRLLGALQSISLAPQSALLAVRGGPLEAGRAAMLMASLAPELERRVADLNRDLGKIRALRTVQETARGEVRTALAGLQELRAATVGALGRRDQAGLAGWAEMRREARAAAARARDLDALSAGLRAAGFGGGGAGFASAKGKLPLPAAARVSGGFGDPDPWGRPGKGMTLEAPGFAQITAPWDATVRYAGPLIDYGQVVVLEPESGYLLVLAGLAHVDREAGEAVLAGEPVGGLGEPIPESEQFLLEAGAQDGQIRLTAFYIEIRHSGEALDPAEWFDLKGSEALR